jgi:hypothetical protein
MAAQVRARHPTRIVNGKPFSGNIVIPRENIRALPDIIV